MKENNLQPLKYNFVFFFASADYWRAILGKELYESEYVHIYERTFNGSALLRLIFRIHWSYRINRYISLPFKFIWFRKMYSQTFKNDLPLCFVYMGGNSIYEDGGFTKYVRKKNSRNRQVMIHNDLISKKCNYDYNIIKNKVDLCITYDVDEAKKYGIHYFQETVYSKLVENVHCDKFEQDVYFLGAAKDRFEKIISVYNKLIENGVTCKFMITGVPLEKRVYKKGLEYTNGISYHENIMNIIKSKCILEIVQGGSRDITTRALEAIAYQRRLLTDSTCCGSLLFNEGQLYVFKEASNISFEFIKNKIDIDSYSPRYDLNPLRRLYDIQTELNKKNEQYR